MLSKIAATRFAKVLKASSDKKARDLLAQASGKFSKIVRESDIYVPDTPRPIGNTKTELKELIKKYKQLSREKITIDRSKGARAEAVKQRLHDRFMETGKGSYPKLWDKKTKLMREIEEIDPIIGIHNKRPVYIKLKPSNPTRQPKFSPEEYYYARSHGGRNKFKRMLANKDEALPITGDRGFRGVEVAVDKNKYVSTTTTSPSVLEGKSFGYADRGGILEFRIKGKYLNNHATGGNSAFVDFNDFKKMKDVIIRSGKYNQY